MNKTALYGLSILLLIAGCEKARSGMYYGYVEGEYHYVSTSAAGRFIEAYANKGDTVAAGAELLLLEAEPEIFALNEAQNRARSAGALALDSKEGARPQEINAIQASMAQVEASLKFTSREFARLEALSQEGAVSTSRLDEARAAFNSDEARLRELQARLKTAMLGQRAGRTEAAVAESRAALASLDAARWRLSQKKVHSPVRALVVDVLYRPGEYVQPGHPVAVLLPVDKRKVRFFVSKDELSLIKPGMNVSVFFSEGPGELEATVTYISARPEYTPPFVYTRKASSKFVFMVEAVFEGSPEMLEAVHPGLPAEVYRKAL